MDNEDVQQVDRGPSTVEDDGPRTPRGMWRLLQTPGVGAARAMALAGSHVSWATMHRAAPDRLVKHVGRKVAEQIAEHGIPEAELTSHLDGDVLTPWTLGYPIRLRDIDGCPPLIWVRGILPSSGRALTIVGARKPWAYGAAVAARAARTCAANDIVTVSGLADGIDTTVAEETLAEGGIHLAVIGSGVDRPRRPDLADRILAAGGAIISEQPPGTAASPGSLVARNRIQTALGDATLVAAAATGSGTAHTARFALLQQRPLWVPAPTRAHADHPAAGLLLALADPDGIANPEQVLHVGGRHGALLANRRPAADRVLADGDALDDAIISL
ncbi:Rossmann fold nucleotide-binding protein (plasmid) [Euzebya pacifica]|uniref:Rossmann fold nucleotide-binding protein n=1 Tax=Euzebya pacifica TaxID=1608957 RepID=A0A346Y6K6_9ACTN|nr:DNA-processing protein DprA [Euzebya pacifica]AXV10103.1 Rossmann fold nucleotide-binding protein [Euzebya pacifica]